MDDAIQNPPPIQELELWDEPSIYGGKLRRIPQKTLNREQMAGFIAEVFHMMGGVPRFARWANDFPDRFYTKILPKAFPAPSVNVQNNNQFNILYAPGIPSSALDQATDVPNHDESETIDAVSDSG